MEAMDLVALCLMWLIWREQTNKYFDREEMLLLKLKSLFHFSPYSWVVGGVQSNPYQFLEVIDNFGI